TDEPDAEYVLAEINGRGADGGLLSSYTELSGDGSTRSGCWIYCGVYADGVNQAARRRSRHEQNELALEWGWAWPANRRILYNRASADPQGRPWSERKALLRWDPEADEGADRRRRAVRHAGRRARLALRPQRPAGRAVARTLRAAGIPRTQPPLPGARRQPGTGDAARAVQPEPAGPRRAGQRGVPLRLQ